MPTGKPSSPRIERRVTFVMVVRRRSWIARFSPPIFRVFRRTRLAPRDGSSGFPSPGMTRERGTGVPPSGPASLPFRRERLASGQLAPSFVRDAQSDGAPKRPVCAIRPVVPRACALEAARATPLTSSGQSPNSVEGRSLPGPLGPGREGDNSPASGRSSGPNWVSVRQGLSVLPAGSASGG